ncbi:MAG: carboxypeptidase-like regulatory domain-containing protein [Saprospiraceae bacterium]|nr:carboxypeptidase-like regulatory domain-containing protein [Saprospiraceae bacterium]
MRIALLFKITIFSCCFTTSSVICQISGTIRDANGDVLPFVSVYIENTGRGTTSNDQGNYELALQANDKVVVFQQIGYEKQKIVLQNFPAKIRKDIILKSIQYNLSDAVFVASKEDPAYPIIRKAIERRKYHERVDSAFECNSYSKGIFKMLDAPDKVMGQSIGNFGGNLDTNRKGILYLSESVSNLKFRKGEAVKEIMLSSKVAGNNRGFSFNRAGALDFNLYKNVTTFGRAIISPIADYAIAHYKYRLKGSNINEEGKLIHKIEVIPKVKADPTWRGYIYIQDSSWNIYEFDGYIFGKQIKQEAFDTIIVQQKHFYFEEVNNWVLRSQNFIFNAGFLGFRMKGSFVLNFSDFRKEERLVIENKDEVLEIVSGANKKTTLYWDSIRPIPLTDEELRNYIVKDSIRIYKESKSYKDSMDRINNKFELTDLLFGYEYNNTWKRTYFSTQNLINAAQFNPIQGLVLGTSIHSLIYLDTFLWKRKIETELDLHYGNADNKIQAGLTQEFHLGDIRNSIFAISGGRKLNAFSPVATTNAFYNQIFSLFYKNNFFKLYQQYYLTGRYSVDLNYDFRLRIELGYFNRSNTINHSNYSFRYRDSAYISNSSTRFQDSFLYVNHSKLLQLRFGIRYQPNVKVWKTPDGIQKLGSDWPEFLLQPTINYYSSIKKFNVMLNLYLRHFADFGRWGGIKTNLSYTRSFLSRSDVPEAIHPGANPFSVNDLSDKMSFKVLRPYQRIGYTRSSEFHVEYNLEGLILDRVYLINKLGFTEILSYSILAMDKDKPYSEFSVGLGNIGYKMFRYLQLNWVKPRYGSAWGPSYLRIGINNVLQIGM